MKTNLRVFTINICFPKFRNTCRLNNIVYLEPLIVCYQKYLQLCGIERELNTNHFKDLSPCYNESNGLRTNWDKLVYFQMVYNVWDAWNTPLRPLNCKYLVTGFPELEDTKEIKFQRVFEFWLPQFLPGWYFAILPSVTFVPMPQKMPLAHHR